MKRAIRTAFGGLTLAGFLAASATSQSQTPQNQQTPGKDRVQGVAQPDKKSLPLELGATQTYSFHVKHGGGPGAKPLGAGNDPQLDKPGAGAQAGGMFDATSEVRFDIRPQGAGQAGATQFTLEVSKAGAGASKVGGAAAGAGDDSGPVGKDLLSYRVTVGDEGRILSMEKLSAGEGLDEERVRCYLSVILGAGLHGSPLEKGKVYRIASEGSPTSQTVEASTPRDGDLGQQKEFFLRFEGTRDAAGGMPADPASGKSAPDASFAIVSEDAGAMGGAAGDKSGDKEKREPGATPGQGALGQASYSMTDGLLKRFDVRPQPTSMQTGQGAAAGAAGERPQWVSIERISAR